MEIPLQPLKDTDVMTFGKHKGKKLSEVPADYFDWWTNYDSTVNTIRLYLYCLENKDVLDSEMEEKVARTEDFSEEKPPW